MKRPQLLLSRSTFWLFEWWKNKIWRNNDVSPLVISTTIVTPLQISALDNRCIHIIILWKYDIYMANVGPYDVFGVHCQCRVCGLSKQGFNRGCLCQIRPFAVTGDHSINSMCYDTIKSKPLVCTGVQEPHMNSSLKDQMSSSLSREKSGFGLDLLLKTVICSNEVL